MSRKSRKKTVNGKQQKQNESAVGKHFRNLKKYWK